MRILLGICGSIAAYKSYDLARSLVKEGHKVRVILTQGALHFVKPEVFSYLGIERVYLPQEDFAFPHTSSPQDLQGTVLHIELSKWAEKMAIVPLTANTLAKLAQGLASDLLSSVFLSLEQTKPILLFPAMNTQMYLHPFTQENLAHTKKLKSLNQVYFGCPESGELACGDIGIGKLPDLEKIIQHILYFSLNSHHIKKILITTGATIAPIDPVRYITNPSSGLTGLIIAQQALAQGHQVEVIAGKYATSRLDLLNGLPRFSLKRVITTQEMQIAVMERFDNCDAYISPAAISDLEFTPSPIKLKKSQMGHNLSFSLAPDILKTALAAKKNQKIIGFAAETELDQEIIEKKWNQKPVDLLVATKVYNQMSSDSHATLTQGFGTNQAQYRFYDGQQFSPIESLSKVELAIKILEQINEGK